MSDANALAKLGLSGDRARRACERLSAEQRALEGAVRRALPYLVRRKISVTAQPVTPALHADAVSGLVHPFHVTALRVGVGGSAGALILDGHAIASGLDGMLGSGRDEPTPLEPAGLTAAQAALAARLARGLVAAFDEVLQRAGGGLAIATESPSDPQGALVVCAVRIGEGESAGNIVILLPAAAIEVDGHVAEASVEKHDPQTHAALAEVELDIVAELGRVRLPLARLASLRVGDMIRLPLSVDAPLRLHVGGRALFEGKPTTRGSQIAVEVLRHGT